MILYALECKTPNHYYVGITKNFDKRMNEHRYGNGASWTKRHGVWRVVVKTEVDDRQAKRLESEMVSRFKAMGREVRGAGDTVTSKAEKVPKMRFFVGRASLRRRWC